MGWVDLGVAAGRAGVSVRTVERWVREGRLVVVGRGASRRVELAAVLRVERERRAARGRPGPRLGVRVNSSGECVAGVDERA
ncbi:hypothetical protein GCM10010466_39760 [Planomonospora alba]|uniref:Helix-turn-helix domain-containing protein n=1 Tax=Planomonospora alba TaxID=161354 RepID=A0ABP6NDM0_9ACTN